MRSVCVPRSRYGEQRAVSLTLTGAILGFFFLGGSDLFQRAATWCQTGGVRTRPAENIASWEQVQSRAQHQDMGAENQAKQQRWSFLSCVPVSRSQEGRGEGENGGTG